MHYRRAFTLYFSKRRETDVLWSYNYIYVIYYTLQVTTIQVHLTVCLWQQHQASFFQNCWAVVENCTRTSSTDWRYYYWVQKSKTKQIKMVVKLWLKSCHVFIKIFLFSVLLHSSQFQSLCSTKSSSETLQNLPYHAYCTMFVFEFFFAKINFLAKAGLEPVTLEFPQ